VKIAWSDLHVIANSLGIYLVSMPPRSHSQQPTGSAGTPLGTFHIPGSQSEIALRAIAIQRPAYLLERIIRVEKPALALLRFRLIESIPEKDSSKSGPIFRSACYAVRRGISHMLKIEAVLQPSKLDAVKAALLEAGIEGMTILEARGHGRQKGHTEFYRGREYTVDLLPKVKIELVLADDLKEKAIAAIIAAARTGRIGDGKIWVSRIDEAIRIRNDERGETAL
jgi:nitrogen regulatory protein P-II 1